MSGHRNAPDEVLRHLLELIDECMRGLNAVAESLKYELWWRERQPKRRRGFCEVRERDGTGSAPRDARWRGGRGA